MDSNSHFEDLAEQFAEELRTGIQPSISNYAAAHPELAGQIRRLFPVMEMMEQKGAKVDDFSEEGLLEAELGQLRETPPMRRLGDYRIVREVGRGGMGIVFEAQQESLGRKVALKLLPQSSQFDQRRQIRFENEARASAMLHHTNIVPIFGVGSHEDNSYFVMQFIEGQPLHLVLHEISLQRSGTGSSRDPANAATLIDTSTIASSLNQSEIGGEPQEESSDTTESKTSRSSNDASSSIRRDGSRTSTENVYWRNIARIGVQVADALSHAHSKKILHRDIKPSNLMIDQTGSAWVTDFGLAKYFESPDLTRTGEIVGTLRYMSPEQINGKSDERSDIFGLGLTLYEMAALQPAYDASDRNQLMKQVLEATPQPLRNIDRRIPRDLETIIQKCIASEPHRRYQDTDNVAADLQRFLDGEPVLARRINPFERISKWCRRRPAIASLLAALVISLICGIAGVTWQWSKTVNALSLANENLEEANRQTHLAQIEKDKADEQAAIANREKIRSESHFKQARDAVNQFFDTVSQQRLLNEPGLLPLRKELLKTALEYHKQFVGEYADDEKVRFEYASSLYRINEIEGQIGGGQNLLENLEEPIQIFEELFEENPDEPIFQIWLSRSIGMKSTMLQRSDSVQALKLLKQSINILESVKMEFDEGILADADLAKNYQVLGLAYESIDRASGRTDRALDYYSKAFDLRAQLHLEFPEDINYAIHFADINRDLGITQRRMGNFDKTVEHYDTAMATLEPIVESNPDHVLARRALASISITIGFFYGSGKTNKEYDKALAYYQKAKDNYLVLAQQNPLVIEYQDGLARAATNAGGVLQATNQLEEALENRQLAAKIRTRLCDLNPDAVFLRSSLAVSLNGVGATLRDMGQIDEAFSMHKDAHKQHALAVKTDSQQPVLRLRLIDGLIQIVRTHSAKLDFVEAIDAVDSIDEYLLPNFSKPHFTKGLELTLIAGKIGDIERKADQPNKDMVTLKKDCLENAKACFEKAAKMGFPVLKQSRIVPALQPGNTRPESKLIQEWLENNFGES
ncbi:serine/threonine-protein kinase [bacterium]|nr:serine/threonine-protein kinase [bacterium]